MKSNMRTMPLALATLLAMVFTALPAQAEEDLWKFEVMPYVWAPGLKGDVTVQGHEESFDYSFNDLVKYVDKGGSLMLAAQYKRWVAWGQGDYFQLESDLNTPAGGKEKLDITIATVAFGYQFDGWMAGQTFDVMIGVQQGRLNNTLTLNAVGSFDTTKSVTDTVLVLRPSIPLSENWRFNPTAVWGKGDSENTYTLWPQFQYQISKTWETRIGYRRLHYDIENDAGTNKLELTMSGPTLGIGATF